MSKLPTVKEHMDRWVHALRPDMPIMEAVDFLLQHRVTSAPVLDATGALIGMLSEKDCLKVLTRGIEGAATRGHVADYMTTELITIEADMDIYFAAGIFLSTTVRRLPVIANGKIVGAITRFDLLRVIQSRLPR